MHSIPSVLGPTAQNDAFLTVLCSPGEMLLLWLFVINLAAFLTFGWDKYKAKYCERHKNGRRVPEKYLFLLAILGGSAGALLGMRVWHHKTRHRSFRIGIPLILTLQLLIAAGIWFCWYR